MGRRKKDDGTEAAAFLVFMVLLAPVYIVIEVIKGIILFINARKEKKAAEEEERRREEARKSREEAYRIKKEKINEHFKNIAEQKMREKLTKANKFDFVNYYEALIKSSDDTNIIERKNKFINGDENEINELLKEYLENKLKNISFNEEYSLNYNIETHTCIIQYNYKKLDSIPKFKKVFHKLSNDLITIEVMEKDRLQEYEEYIHRETLRIIDIIFSFHEEYINNIIFEGYVNQLNQATGYNENFVILSINVPKEAFSKINIENVIPKLCLQTLGYSFVKNLYDIKPIEPFKPIEENRKNDNVLKDIDLDISDMNGYEFEDFPRDLLIADGFEEVEVTSSSGDFGADVIAYKNQIKYAVQCKKYSQPVGVKAIQEVMGSKSIYGCHVAVVLTNNTFTPQARKLAEQNNVLLWDRIKLQDLIENYKKQLNN